jgi:head-tail adaptor
MTAAVKLTRRLVIEEREAVPDGSGGFSDGWRALGMVWAEVEPRAGGERLVGGRVVSRVRYRIRLRAAPVGAVSRPRPDQRLREGARVFDILAVTEHDAAGRWLEIVAEEGVRP